MQQKLDFVTFGEAMAMFIANEPLPLHEVNEFKRELAGAETNVAIGMARLGFHASWVSKVGDDAFGRYIKQRLISENVDISQVKTDFSHPTGFQLKSKVQQGDPEVQYFRKESAASQMEAAEIDESHFRSAQHLHLTGIPLAISDSARGFAKQIVNIMKDEGRTISFDPNLRPSLWKSKEEMIQITNETAFLANHVLPGIEEGEILTGYTSPEEISQFYMEQGVELVVIKLGAQGAYFRSRGHGEGYVKGYEAKELIDTVGAGDGFAVGFISGMLEGLTVEDAVRRGNAIGSLAVQFPGDNDGYPDRNKLQKFMEIQNQGV